MADSFKTFGAQKHAVSLVFLLILTRTFRVKINVVNIIIEIIQKF